MAAHRYWRVFITSNYGGAQTGLSQIMLRATAGDANLSVTGNGTATGDSTNGSPSTLFTGSPSVWYSGSTLPQTITWDFGAGNEKDIQHITLKNTAAFPEFNPQSVQIRFSDDNVTWNVFSIGINQNGPSLETVFTYTAPAILTADLVFPSLSVTGRSGARAAVTLPAPGLSLSSGAVASITFHAPTVVMLTGASAGITFPGLSVTSQGHDSTGERAAAITLPSLSVAARAGANAKATLPGLTSQSAGTVTTTARAALTLPSLAATAGATASASGSAALTLPSMSRKSYAGALCSVTIGTVTMESIGTTGAVGGASISLPLFEVASVATEQNHGSAHLMLPSLSLHSGGDGAAITLPGLELVAIGSAVITATYEAYAVNLKHADPNASAETTRYTNFPFTHVVRYKNSYYGANSTGLYLLEGTTDNGAAIPWAFKTAMTDFKSANKKTLAAAYFSGRFGPASTIRLHEGEKTPQTYSFTTPRGTLAQNHRQKFGKGTKGRYYAISAAGTGACELDGIECDVQNTTRRI